MAVYATAAELAAHIAPTTVPATADRLLTRASRDVDQALLSAVYPVDDDGQPTETAHADALRDATLEQAAYRMTLGDSGAVTPGIPAGWGSVKIGSIAIGGSSGGGGITAGAAGARIPLGPDAWAILQAAGLTGTGPYAWG